MEQTKCPDCGSKFDGGVDAGIVCPTCRRGIVEVALSSETFALKELIEAAGYEVRSYSGRGMFGDTCIAVTLESESRIGIFSAHLIDAADTGEERELAIHALDSIRTDSMGLGIVVYFPLFGFTEDHDE